MKQLPDTDLTLIGSIPNPRLDSFQAERQGLRRPIEGDTSYRPGALFREVYRSILAVDISGSTRRDNAAKARLRHTMYELVDEALRAGGIVESYREPFVDRGDSVLALIRPADEIAKSLLLDTVVPELAGLLTEHNRLHPEHGFQLRVVIHAGDVHYDRWGWFGEPLDLAFRLLDAPEVKKALLRTKAPIVLVVSEAIHHSIICQGYEGIDTQSFWPIVRVRLADRSHRGWLMKQPVPAPVEASAPDAPLYR